MRDDIEQLDTMGEARYKRTLIVLIIGDEAPQSQISFQENPDRDGMRPISNVSCSLAELLTYHKP